MAAVIVCVLAAGYCLLIATFVAACLPGAPFFHVDIDNRFVTLRRFGSVERKLLRDVDGWAYQQRRKTVVRHALRFEVRTHTVVARPQGFDERRVRSARGELLELHTALFTPLFCDKAWFAKGFADCLTASVDAARQSRRPIVLDVSPELAAQAFELTRPAATAAPARETTPKRKRKNNSVHTGQSGRFPTNANLAAYWRGRATQAVKASDDSADSAYEAEKAYLYEELAKRDRKRIARARRAQRPIPKGSEPDEA